MDTREVVTHLDALIARADALIAASKGMSRYLDPELRAEFRTSGLSFLCHLLGEHDVHYLDFEQCSRGISVPHAQKAKGLLRAIRDELLEGRLPPTLSTSESHAMNRRRVFVVHGRNQAARQAMFGLLRAMGLQPLEWSEAISLTGSSAPFVGEVLDTAFREAQAVVILLTGDDVARLDTAFVTQDDPPYEKELTPQARPNVLFEAGMALGRHPKRTILVSLGKTRPFSDIAGRHTLRLTNSSTSRQEFLSRLKTAGCDVDDASHRTDWLGTGDFEGAVHEPDDLQNNPTRPDEKATRPNESPSLYEEKKYSLLSLIHQLRLIATSFPSHQSKGEEIRNVTLWPESDMTTLRSLAASFGMASASFAAEAVRHLATIADLAKTVQQTPRARGFNWNQFDWNRWISAIEGAERCLLSLATTVDPDWRSLV